MSSPHRSRFARLFSLSNLLMLRGRREVGSTTTTAKLVALLAVLYVALPVDLIPDVAPLIGWLDDVGVTAAAAWMLARAAADHFRARALVPVPVRAQSRRRRAR